MNDIHQISIFALALSIGYMFFILYMLSHEHPKKYPLSSFPKISVLIAFRNEEKNIGACCNALDRLDYPKDKLEILMLNDQSSDNSPQIVKDYISGGKSFRLINIDSELNNLKAKMNVLAQGIQKSTGEYIFITDADCRPSSNWLKTMLQYFDPSVGMVSGFTILQEEQPKLFSRLQTVDWIFLQGLALAASNINKPIGVMGNNLAFRRSVYDQVGGFESIGFSITEDHALMRAIINKTNQKAKYVCDKEGIVFSLPVANFKEFVNQRLRWIRGGLEGSFFAFFLVGFSFIAHFTIILLFSLSQWNIISATAIGLIIGIDYFMLKKHLKALGLEKLKKHFIKFEIFYIFYPIILFLLTPFSKTISWKDRKF